jgi:hypothetical protein
MRTDNSIATLFNNMESAAQLIAEHVPANDIRVDYSWIKEIDYLLRRF